MGWARKKASAGSTGLVRLVRLAGFEPTTPWFVAKYSIQLSYSREAGKYNRPGTPARGSTGVGVRWREVAGVDLLPRPPVLVGQHAVQVLACTAHGIGVGRRRLRGRS